MVLLKGVYVVAAPLPKHLQRVELCAHEGENGLLLVAQIDDGKGGILVGEQVDDGYLQGVEVLHLIDLYPMEAFVFGGWLLQGVVGLHEQVFEVYEVVVVFVSCIVAGQFHLSEHGADDVLVAIVGGVGGDERAVGVGMVEDVGHELRCEFLFCDAADGLDGSYVVFVEAFRMGAQRLGVVVAYLMDEGLEMEDVGVFASPSRVGDDVVFVVAYVTGEDAE